MIRKFFQPFYTAYVVITFLISLFLAFPFFLLISTANNIWARRTIWFIIRHWSRVWLWMIGMPLKTQGKMPAGKYVIVANHISYLDTVVIFAAIPSYFRALGKIEISKIPVLGFVYRQIVVMVDRSSAQSRALSMRLMWRVLKHESNIIIFPEGTFNETGDVLKDFYDGAFRLACNTNTPILPILFPDTVNRWHYSKWWKLWPGKNRAVFLPPITPDGKTPAHIAHLKQQTYDAMHAGLSRLGYKH